MKRITFRADADIIERARQIAKARGTTLNVAFGQWLKDYASRKGDVQAYQSLMRRLKHIDSKGPYTRDEMNER